MPQGRPPRSIPPRWRGPLLLTLRLLVLGIGLGVITGTGLKLLAPQLIGPRSGATDGESNGRASITG